MNYKPLPIGVDDFEDLRTNDYFYVDKSLFIKELIDYKGKVNLFTRPRRFGKTLNMSMLQMFFENTSCAVKNENRRQLFSGLNIMNTGDRYLSQMTGYPVISLSLKSGKQPTYELAYASIKDEIIEEYNRHNYIVESNVLLENEKIRFKNIQNGVAEPIQYAKALDFLSKCLEKYHNEKVIVLIDEYDVPLENAYFSGFYDEMMGFIRSLFESALKTNPCLAFAVVTGCLRISQESIFTGLNNLEVISVINDFYSEHFGFTQEEVEGMLEFYGRPEAFLTMKEWYDGYLFGKTEVYNPWSTINYMKVLWRDKHAFPEPFWSNTSSNNIVKGLVETADLSVRGEIEDLIKGGSIEKVIHEEITYADVYEAEDNLWNFLFFTGYLKQSGRRMEGDRQYVIMTIPNTEVRYIYKNVILNWFDKSIKQKDLTPLFTAIEQEDTNKISKELSISLQETISFYDYAENYYHGFLTGILKNMRTYHVISNRESGLGRPDIIIQAPSVQGKAIIIEIKVAKIYNEMEEKCEEAIQQITEKNYESFVRDEGYQDIIKYGICFYKKECLVKVADK